MGGLVRLSSQVLGSLENAPPLRRTPRILPTRPRLILATPKVAITISSVQTRTLGHREVDTRGHSAVKQSEVLRLGLSEFRAMLLPRQEAVQSSGKHLSARAGLL